MTSHPTSVLINPTCLVNPRIASSYLIDFHHRNGGQRTQHWPRPGLIDYGAKLWPVLECSMNLDEVGTWDGDVFRFHKPIQVGEAVMENIDFSEFKGAEGVTREDVIHAFLNPVKVVWAGDPDVG